MSCSLIEEEIAYSIYFLSHWRRLPTHFNHSISPFLPERSESPLWRPVIESLYIVIHEQVYAGELDHCAGKLSAWTCLVIGRIWVSRLSRALGRQR